jgi:hypothetical protein
MDGITLASPRVHLSAAFPGESVGWETYSNICDRLSRPHVIVTLMPGRCGSTFLAGVIRGTGLCGTGEEVFNEVTADQWRGPGSTLLQVFEFCLRKGLAGGVCWIQIAPERFESLAHVVDPRVLRSWKYTVLLRRDIVSQAISYVYAVNSGVWHSFDGKTESKIQLDSTEAVKAVINRLGLLEAVEFKIRTAIRRYAGSNYLAQFYEDVVAAPREEALRFLRFQGKAYDIAKLSFDTGVVRRLKKVGDIELYAECCRRVPWIERLVAERKQMPTAW